MKVALSVHALYMILLLLSVLVHRLLPLYNKYRIIQDMAELKNEYNDYIQEISQETQKFRNLNIENIKKIRELVVYSDIIGCNRVRTLFKKEHSNESIIVNFLYDELLRKINRPKKVWIVYSVECNLGIVCSFLLPCTLVILTNIKGLIKTHSLRHCFMRSIYGV
ncbi:hypothetical protein NEPAR06_1100 [Nematocida parisii]|uniref:Uncharacterized protein n=1 Tax=Nematocida parisii (strain ERTm3) TaxID=935791 RepID=I3EII4_NEMP3|nr:uncharacterized protein NEPG_01756 [Nematocida parisii ERTm1]EIJ89031.1 hypothetical protein NEQG_00850 [Nematocida parisii ERTm3]EIJ93414.1 hypothetical protein NEPG_01756 [Nematocida parisii ERTm1]KAI5144431.1 hypothetical protein NEPAR07_1089 [Nematocida parisii]KAI5154415.1 hypothetical protein NEPAR06_1100 [Nematocida parisii]|eukprot:XP_013059584.1 hypothetical protein NEPG_01756 [Nematocida parisii ERTm1]